jgi:DMSO/TMAO reductase YedYZ molybdopterin-dependent catalytic subunit
MVLKVPGQSGGARDGSGDRVPPGQRVTDGWPVLTYGSAPRIDLQDWRFVMAGEVEREVTLTWEEFAALPDATLTNDIHCVTGWSKLDNQWRGVRFRDVAALAGPKPTAQHVMVHCHGGYTTNVPLADLMRDDVLFAHSHNGKPLAAEHGGPLRLVVPHLYFWKSAKWARGLLFMKEERPGFWEMYGYHIRGDPWKEERYA